MIAFCKHDERKKHGKDCKGNQRFCCKDCGATFSETAPKSLGNMRIAKLIIAHEVGGRDSTTCCTLLQKLADFTVGRFQLSTDGLGTYRLNVPFTFFGSGSTSSSW